MLPVPFLGHFNQTLMHYFCLAPKEKPVLQIRGPWPARGAW